MGRGRLTGERKLELSEASGPGRELSSNDRAHTTPPPIPANKQLQPVSWKQISRRAYHRQADVFACCDLCRLSVACDSDPSSVDELASFLLHPSRPPVSEHVSIPAREGGGSPPVHALGYASPVCGV